MTSRHAEPADDTELVRRLAPQVLATLVRHDGGLDRCEDAVQEAVAAAVAQWPRDGRPANPVAWLTTVARRRLTDVLRADEARRNREARVARRDRMDEPVGDPVPAADDTLALLVLCCHPELTPPAQLALTLRAVCGLTTAEIAAACFVPEATMGQRISRAKQRIRESGARFELTSAADLDARLPVVLHVLYLMFNEGYAASSGPVLQRPDLTGEAIRLTREVHAIRSSDGEVAGLLALMLLTEARRAARTDGDGNLVRLADQDRGRWDRELIAEGVALVTHALRTSPLGPYQLQAAIAAVHDEAPDVESTDWVEVLGLYQLLERVAPSPVVSLNRAVALAMVDGARAGLAALDALADDPRVGRSHRWHAARGDLLERAGAGHEALAAYRSAARLAMSVPERREMERRAARLAAAPPASYEG